MIGPLRIPTPINPFTLLAGIASIGILTLAAPAAHAQQDELRQLEDFLAPPAPSAPVAPPAAAPAPPAAPTRPPAAPTQPVRSAPAPTPQRPPAQVQEPRERPSQVPTAPDSGNSASTEQVENENVAVRTTGVPRLELGPEYGQGNFIVLMTYDGEDSLTRAREYSAGAFVKQINGDEYIQLAVFDQLEYARHLADRLRGQGLSVLVAN